MGLRTKRFCSGNLLCGAPRMARGVRSQLLCGILRRLRQADLALMCVSRRVGAPGVSGERNGDGEVEQVWGAGKPATTARLTIKTKGGAACAGTPLLGTHSKNADCISAIGISCIGAQEGTRTSTPCGTWT